MSTPSPAPVPPVAQMLQLGLGKWITHMLIAAARLGIADLVAEEPKTAEQLAAATGTHAPSLYRLLRALASTGVFAEDCEGCFRQTELSALMRTDATPSLRYNLIMMGDDWHTRSWDELLYAIETGKPSIEKVTGTNAFDYLQRHPAQAENFNRAMSGLSSIQSSVVADAYDFSGFKKIVDVAGGHGHLVGTILVRNPHLEGVLFDMPQVIEGANGKPWLANLDGRLTLATGSFFESVPAGADAYIMKHIIHDWDDEQAAAILANCRKAIPPSGKLLLIENVIEPGNAPSFAKLLDIEMLVLPGGRERTEAEFQTLLAESDFRLTRIVPTLSAVCIIEAEPANS